MRAEQQPLLSAATRLYRASFRRCLPLALIGTVLSAAAGAYASARVGVLSRQFDALMNADVSAPGRLVTAFGQVLAQAHALVRSPLAWLSYLGAALIVLIFHGALIGRQQAVQDAQADSLPGALSGALRRLPSIVLVIGIFAAAAAIAVMALRIASHAGMAALSLLGLILTAAVFWLWGRLQLWLVALFTEDTGAIGAIHRSWVLVRGHWLRASALTTVPYLVIFALSSVASLAGAAAGALLRADASAASVLTGVLSLISGALTLPMLPVVWLALYHTLGAHDGDCGGGSGQKEPRQRRGRVIANAQVHRQWTANVRRV